MACETRRAEQQWLVETRRAEQQWLVRLLRCQVRPCARTHTHTRLIETLQMLCDGDDRGNDDGNRMEHGGEDIAKTILLLKATFLRMEIDVATYLPSLLTPPSLVQSLSSHNTNPTLWSFNCVYVCG